MLKKAYVDDAFPIAAGQTISQPYTVARQTELIQPQPGSRILEIGTGSGYQTCVLAYLGCIVYSVERHAELSESAKKKLDVLGLEATLKVGDGTEGWHDHAPYDGILVTAGAPVVPQDLKEQLAIGGRLVIPVGDTHMQEMLCITREARYHYNTETFGGFSFVPLIGSRGWK